jgi:hypothetical protein
MKVEVEVQELVVVTLNEAIGKAEYYFTEKHLLQQKRISFSADTMV